MYLDSKLPLILPRLIVSFPFNRTCKVLYLKARPRTNGFSDSVHHSHICSPLITNTTLHSSFDAEKHHHVYRYA